MKWGEKIHVEDGLRAFIHALIRLMDAPIPGVFGHASDATKISVRQRSLLLFSSRSSTPSRPCQIGRRPRRSRVERLTIKQHADNSWLLGKYEVPQMSCVGGHLSLNVVPFGPFQHMVSRVSPLKC
jgi:hypothetical protein